MTGCVSRVRHGRAYLMDTGMTACATMCTCGGKWFNKVVIVFLFDLVLRCILDIIWGGGQKKQSVLKRCLLLLESRLSMPVHVRGGCGAVQQSQDERTGFAVCTFWL